MAHSLLESTPEKIAGNISSLIDDLVAATLESNLAAFIKAHDVSVSGAEQPAITFQFDAVAFAIAFNVQLLAALGTKDIEGNEGNISHRTVAPV
jgi:hypothetical protein